VNDKTNLFGLLNDLVDFSKVSVFPQIIVGDRNMAKLTMDTKQVLILD